MQAACWSTTALRVSIHIPPEGACACSLANGANCPAALNLRRAGVSSTKMMLFTPCLTPQLIWIPARLCIVVECPNPFVLMHGSVYPPQEKYFVDNETTYECYSGYTLRGSARRVCLPNGKWSGSTPICSRDCESTSLILMFLKTVEPLRWYIQQQQQQKYREFLPHWSSNHHHKWCQVRWLAFFIFGGEKKTAGHQWCQNGKLLSRKWEDTLDSFSFWPLKMLAL